MKMRVYIAGPITGLREGNRVEFAKAEGRLRAAGYEPINPLELGIPFGASWHDCMCRCLEELVRCQAIWRLRGWQGSRGARLEVHMAQELGLLEITETMLAARIEAARRAEGREV